MIWQFALRAILGVALAGLGYWVSAGLIPANFFPGSQYLPILIVVLLGIAGVFLVPAAASLARQFLSSFVRLLAKELLNQIPFPRMGRAKVSGNSSVNLVLDTSAIIDGRISEIAKTGFLTGTLIIPRFILRELQHIADSADEMRRSRGRRGFEVIEELKKVATGIKVEVSSVDFTKLGTVDDKLVQLAKRFKARIVTTDYNLNKVAHISGIKTLNVNELANAIKTVLIPGEEIKVKIIQPGKEREQGVGFLPDGTMIVVEGGASQMGKFVEARVERVFQTVAGRMVFVRPKSQVK